MYSLLRWILWIVAVSVAVSSVAYFIVHFPSTSFTENAMGNLFATILGVLVGVPIALELSRRQQQATLFASLTERQSNEATRKRKVLALLRNELSLNLAGIGDRRASIKTGGKREVYTQSLQDQLWATFSDGGELQYVNNPDLLAALADAYNHVRYSIMLERKTFDAIHFSGMRIQQDKYPADYFLDYLNASDPNLINSIEKVVKMIDQEPVSALQQK